MAGGLALGFTQTFSALAFSPKQLPAKGTVKGLFLRIARRKRIPPIGLIFHGCSFRLPFLPCLWRADAPSDDFRGPIQIFFWADLRVQRSRIPLIHFLTPPYSSFSPAFVLLLLTLESRRKLDLPLSAFPACPSELQIQRSL